jgi:hypothetical protein
MPLRDLKRQKSPGSEKKADCPPKKNRKKTKQSLANRCGETYKHHPFALSPAVKRRRSRGFGTEVDGLLPQGSLPRVKCLILA